MADPNDDLFSDLDAIEAPKAPAPPTRTIPNLADSLRDLGLIDDEADPVHEVEPLPPVVEPMPVAVAAPPVELAPVVEPEVEPEANPPQFEDADEEPEAELHLEPDAPSETPAQAELDPEPAVVQQAPVPVEKPVNDAPAVGQGSIFSHHRVWILGGAVAICAIGGWLLFGSSNKESTVQPPQPVAIEPAPAPVAEPVVVATPEVAEPEPAPVVETVVPAAPIEPTSALPAKPTVAAAPKPAAPKPQRAPESKPVAKPKPEPQWQDKAMDALDDLEKRL